MSYLLQCISIDITLWDFLLVRNILLFGEQRRTRISSGDIFTHSTDSSIRILLHRCQPHNIMRKWDSLLKKVGFCIKNRDKTYSNSIQAYTIAFTTLQESIIHYTHLTVHTHIIYGHMHAGMENQYCSSWCLQFKTRATTVHSSKCCTPDKDGRGKEHR